jgi:cell division GTPase FtsZ
MPVYNANDVFDKFILLKPKGGKIKMEVMLFGIGAAGNKAAINVLEKGILDENHVRLLNTTVKDIPENYKINNKGIVFKFSSMLGGCGKEPTKGRSAMFQAIKDRKIDFGSLISPDTKAVFIVTSVEGGTGCGATPVVARFYQSMNIPVHVFAFIGFQDEARGISNSLKFFKELGSNVVLHTIRNEKFLDYTQTYAKAEVAANDEFAKQVEILVGANMIDSAQNIDDTDHYKMVATYGYSDIHHVDLTNVKNNDQFNKAVSEAFENASCLDYDPDCKRLAVIVNASEKTQAAVDNKFEVIKRYVGEPFEIFRHIQTNNVIKEEYIDIIAVGMSFPEQGIVEMSRKYATLKENLNTGVKSFEDIFGGIDFDDDEDEFNMNVRQMANPDKVVDDFLSSMEEAAATKMSENKKIVTEAISADEY